MNEQEFAELSAGHALNALSAADEQAYQDARAAHPEWDELTQVDAATVAALADGAAPVAPPLDARSRLLSAIAAMPQGVSGGVTPSAVPPATAPEFPEPQAAVPGAAATEVAGPDAAGTEVAGADATGADAAEPDAADPRVTSTPAPSTEMMQTVQRRNWSRGLFALVASIVLLVGIGWGVGSVSRLWQTPPAEQMLAQIEAAPDAASASVEFDGGTATAHWSADVGEAVLVTAGLPSIEADRTFEMWVVHGEAAPVSAGTFEASGGDGVAILEAPMEPGDTIAVTVEQDGGSPSGAPTTDPIVAVPTA